MAGETLRSLIMKVREEHSSLASLKKMYMSVRTEMSKSGQAQMLSAIAEKESDIRETIAALQDLSKELESRLGDIPFAEEAKAPYANMTQIDAVRDVIQQSEVADTPISTREVYNALVEGGYPFRSRDAIKSLSVLISKNIKKEWIRDEGGSLRVIKHPKK